MIHEIFTKISLTKSRNLSKNLSSKLDHLLICYDSVIDLYFIILMHFRSLRIVWRHILLLLYISSLLFFYYSIIFLYYYILVFYFAIEKDQITLFLFDHAWYIVKYLIVYAAESSLITIKPLSIQLRDFIQYLS